HGCHVVLPLLNKEIPIVCDEHADMTKGTGVVKITPAHDPNDFEVGLRHNLPIVRVFTYDGHMTGAADKAAADALFAAGKNTINEPEVLDCGKYAGMTTLEARKAILADLEAGGFLKEIEPLKHEVGTCYRCHSTIEPMVSKQWFVKMEPLAKPAIESVEKGEIKFVPERFTKNYMNWMKNTRDWCISRQLWWGHQIPAWYCDDCGETVVAKSAPCACPKCGSAKLTQDPDTLDTWFSSALWPFSTLGWPNEESEDLKYFYPTNTLVTGYDIIGFWVSRMIFSGLAYTGKAPFSTVCIHGIVRDSQGRKMSKSLGNGIDPLEVIAQYGADALRFMLVDGSTPGNDMRYIEKKVEAARNFANKLWNATRFVLMNLPEDFTPGLPSEEMLDMSDKWVLTKLNQVAGAMTDNLDHYEMGLAAAKINSFIWDVYCDWFIEIAKPRLNSGDAQQADTARRVLVYVLDKALKLLHPFMPFITEELYQALPGSAETIMTQSWPTFDEAHNWADEEEAFEKVMDYIKAVRTMRTEMNVHPAKKTSMIIETADAAPFQKAQVYLAKFAFATDVTFTEKYEGSTDGMVQVSTHAARGFIPMMELIDRDKELARLNKEKAKAEKEMAMFANQLNNPKFVERAPAALVEDIRNKYAKSQDKLANIEQSIKALG
ncbi:MAG: valine--tRNA ligase, partial [Faecalibacterium sp.]|nr:valine--tRNA ligase [Faecalibacterium sp.]